MFFPLAIVENVRVMELNSSLVVVSWDPISGVPWLTGYMVYYSWTAGRNQSDEFSVNVSSSENSVVIGDLRTDVLYQFQVIGVAELDGVTYSGTRFVVDGNSIASLRGPTVAPRPGNINGGTYTSCRLFLSIMPLMI